VSFAALLLLTNRQLMTRTHFRWSAAAIAALVIGMPMIAFVSGSLDREVLSEAPKSLQYRLEYWSATGQLLRDHWFLGTGPGNFRQSYLQYKLAGSSEEILDPHNLFLDVWANGGLLALGGLIAMLALIVRRAIDVSSAVLSDALVEDERPIRTMCLLGALGTVSLGLAAGFELINGGGSSSWSALVAGWWGMTFVASAGLRFADVRRFAAAALIGLVIHLLGAGGIAMPAILQLVLMLSFVIDHAADRAPSAMQSEWRPTPDWLVPAGMLTALALVIACCLTATIPVTKSRASLNIGRSLQLTEHQSGAAERMFEQSAQDDPLTAEPWQELAGVRLGRWQQTAVDQDFKQAVAAQQQAIERDPRNASRWRGLGEIWDSRWQKWGDEESALAAAAALREAVIRYPNQAAAQAALAVAAQRSGEAADALEAAQKALKLDTLNRQRGHVDKFLTAAQLAELHKISESDSADPGE
ncbi:MAG: O-antigen ligase family protein, partial [Planctomycetaceae bacterium]|nr:O-antigen ligase family protein [Planctomycetaceae bacterium]